MFSSPLFKQLSYLPLSREQIKHASVKNSAKLHIRYVFATFTLDLRHADNETTSRTIPTFLTLYIFGFFYQLVLVYDALRLKNTIQIIGLCAYNVGLLIYGSVQMDQIREAVFYLAAKQDIDLKIWVGTKPYLIAIPAVLGVGTVLLAMAAWKLYDEFAWTIYKHISADLRMKRRYLTFQVYIALLKFDFFFFLGFTVQFVVIVTNKTNVEFGLTLAAIPVTIAILIMAAYWTRRENKIGMVFTIVSFFLGSFPKSDELMNVSSSSISVLSHTFCSRWCECTRRIMNNITWQHGKSYQSSLPLRSFSFYAQL